MSSGDTDGGNAQQGGQRQFLAMRAARWLGGFAQKATASIARLATCQTAQALRFDLEKRAAGPAENRETLVSEWAKLLAAADDTPRYEDPDGALTFRAVFVGSQALEILLAATARDSCQDPEADVVKGSDSWKTFLRSVAIPGGEDAITQLLKLLVRTANVPDCRIYADDAVAVLKQDSHHEVLKCRCTTAGSQAEAIRTSLRSAGRPTVTAVPHQVESVLNSAEERCANSSETLRLYKVFQENLKLAAVNIKEVAERRASMMQVLDNQLCSIASVAADAKESAEARSVEAQRSCDEAIAAPRTALADLEADPSRLGNTAITEQLEEERKKQQIEFEDVSKMLALKRQENKAIQKEKEDMVAAHRQQADEIERNLQELTPAKYHGVASVKAESMTENEIVVGLSLSAESIADLASKVRSAREAQLDEQVKLLENKLRTIEKQGPNFLKTHARLELDRLEAAGTCAAEAVSTLVDAAQSRVDMASLGLSPENEDMYGVTALPDRREIRRLQGALREAKDAWDEVVGVWGGSGAEGETSLALALAVSEATFDEMLSELDNARGRISQVLVPLQKVDPALHDLVLYGDIDALDSEDIAAAAAATEVTENLPYGWESHMAPSGHIYYHSLVTQQTQWEAPKQDAAVNAGWRLFQADDGAWFYHNPYDGSGVWWPELPKGPAQPSSLEDLRLDVRQ